MFLMILPFGALLAAILWLAAPGLRDSKGLGEFASESPATEVETPAAMQHGFEANLLGLGQVQLAPLHATEQRQLFDAEALGGLLGVEGGMPWRLRITLGKEQAGGASDWSLWQVREEGATWSSFPVHQLPEDSPLAGLMAKPEGAPGPGAFDWILWGPRVSVAPHLEHAGKRIPFEAASWLARGEDEALLRLEPLR